MCLQHINIISKPIRYGKSILYLAIRCAAYIFLVTRTATLYSSVHKYITICFDQNRDHQVNLHCSYLKSCCTSSEQILVIVFTLVVTVDSKAADTIKHKIHKMVHRRYIKILISQYPLSPDISPSCFTSTACTSPAVFCVRDVSYLFYSTQHYYEMSCVVNIRLVSLTCNMACCLLRVL
jgi:hypothetical protein